MINDFLIYCIIFTIFLTDKRIFVISMIEKITKPEFTF